MLEAGPIPCGRRWGAGYARAIRMGAGSASVPGDRAYAQLEDGSNGLDSVRICCSTPWVGSSVACDRSCAEAPASLVLRVPDVFHRSL